MPSTLQYSWPAILSCPIPAGVLPSLPHQSTIRRVRAEHLSAQSRLRHHDLEDTTTRATSISGPQPPVFLGLGHQHFWASETTNSGPRKPLFLGFSHHQFWASATSISGPQPPSILGLGHYHFWASETINSGPQKPLFLGLNHQHL